MKDPDKKKIKEILNNKKLDAKEFKQKYFKPASIVKYEFEFNVIRITRVRLMLSRHKKNVRKLFVSKKRMLNRIKK